MYNSRYVTIFIAIFVVLFTSPFWLNILTDEYEYPKLSIPTGKDGQALECVEPAEWMRSNHMDLLDDWRNAALRDEKRIYISSTGKEWEASLQNTCMTCHANYDNFCLTCHTQNAVEPYCWDCHIEPEGITNE